VLQLVPLNLTTRMDLPAPTISVQATIGFPVASSAMVGLRDSVAVLLTPTPCALPASSTQFVPSNFAT